MLRIIQPSSSAPAIDIAGCAVNSWRSPARRVATLPSHDTASSAPSALTSVRSEVPAAGTRSANDDDDEHAQPDREVGRDERREGGADRGADRESRGRARPAARAAAQNASSTPLRGHCARAVAIAAGGQLRASAPLRRGRGAVDVVVAGRVGGGDADDRDADRLDAVLGEQLAELDDARLQAAAEADDQQQLVRALGERQPVDHLGQRRRVDRSTKSASSFARSISVCAVGRNRPSANGAPASPGSRASSTSKFGP